MPYCVYIHVVLSRLKKAISYLPYKLLLGLVFVKTESLQIHRTSPFFAMQPAIGFSILGITLLQSYRFSYFHFLFVGGAEPSVHLVHEMFLINKFSLVLRLHSPLSVCSCPRLPWKLWRYMCSLHNFGLLNEVILIHGSRLHHLDGHFMFSLPIASHHTLYACVYVCMHRMYVHVHIYVYMHA